MRQCQNCKNLLFFKPLPDETFSCCSAWGEQVEDIDLKTGFSPKVQKYETNNILCAKKEKGVSVCEPPKSRPFDVLKVRIEGEEYLRQQLGVV